VRGGSLRRKEPSLVPEELVPHLKLAQEWGRRKAAQLPEWSPDKWRRVAAILDVEIDLEGSSNLIGVEARLRLLARLRDGLPLEGARGSR